LPERIQLRHEYPDQFLFGIHPKVGMKDPKSTIPWRRLPRLSHQY
jgi:hypothetical protein